MCSLIEVNNPEGRALDWRSQNRHMSFINVACLALSLISTAISIGALVIYRTDSSNAPPAEKNGQTIPENNQSQQQLTVSPMTTAWSTIPRTEHEPEPLKRAKFFQGLKEVPKHSLKLEWQDGGSIKSSHTITETGSYYVYVQVTFKGACRGNIELKTTLCKNQEKIIAKELLVTSMSVCENTNSTNWTRTLSQTAIFYFEESDDIYINTTSMKYVEFTHNYNNIFGIYRL